MNPLIYLLTYYYESIDISSGQMVVYFRLLRFAQKINIWSFRIKNILTSISKTFWDAKW